MGPRVGPRFVARACADERSELPKSRPADETCAVVAVLQRINAWRMQPEQGCAAAREPSHESPNLCFMAGVTRPSDAQRPERSPASGCERRGQRMPPLTRDDAAGATGSTTSVDLRRARMGPPEGTSTSSRFARRNPHPGPPLILTRSRCFRLAAWATSGSRGLAFTASRARQRGNLLAAGGLHDDGVANANSPSSKSGPSPERSRRQVRPCRAIRSDLVRAALAPQTHASPK